MDTKKDNCSIPLVGGPFCGEYLQMTNGRLIYQVPLYHEFKFHVYELVLEKSDKFVDIHYRFTGKILEIEEISEYKI